MHTAMHAHIYIHPACPSSGPASSSSKLVAPVVSVASSLFGIMEIFSQPKKPVEHPGRGPSLPFFFFRHPSPFCLIFPIVHAPKYT